MNSSHQNYILQLQQSIQTLVHDIEKEKTNLHISQERNSKIFMNIMKFWEKQ